MAKNNNLTDFLTDLANKIRTTGLATGTINPQNFSGIITGLGLPNNPMKIAYHKIQAQQSDSCYVQLLPNVTGNTYSDISFRLDDDNQVYYSTHSGTIPQSGVYFYVTDSEFIYYGATIVTMVANSTGVLRIVDGSSIIEIASFDDNGKTFGFTMVVLSGYVLILYNNDVQ